MAVTFDTLKYPDRLKAAGVAADVAEAQAEALNEVFESNLKELATKEDLRHLEERLTDRFGAKLIRLEQRMTIKPEALMVVAVGAVAALARIL